MKDSENSTARDYSQSMQYNYSKTKIYELTSQTWTLYLFPPLLVSVLIIQSLPFVMNQRNTSLVRVKPKY